MAFHPQSLEAIKLRKGYALNQGDG